MKKLELDTQKIYRLWGHQSMAELARRLGVSRQLLHYWLSARAVQAAPRIAPELGLDAKDLIR